MSVAQNYIVAVFENDSMRSAVSFRDAAGQFDLRFGWAKYTSSMHSPLEDAMADFRNCLQKEHDKNKDGIIVKLGDPRIISEQDAMEQSPSAHSGTDNAP